MLMRYCPIPLTFGVPDISSHRPLAAPPLPGAPMLSRQDLYSRLLEGRRRREVGAQVQRSHPGDTRSARPQARVASGGGLEG